MKKLVLITLILAQACLQGEALAAPAKLNVTLDGITDNKPIPTKFAYCMPDSKGHTIAGGNISPAISWAGAPQNTRSFVIMVVDPDVPAKFDTANKEGKVILATFPRQNFYHWVLVNIPPSVKGLLEGKDSNGVTTGGKPTGKTEYGVNGINGYGFGGYDGPCPPWNDERLHHYEFHVYALDIPSVKLPDPVKAVLVKSEMEGHILAEGKITGTYSNNPALLSNVSK